MVSKSIYDAAELILVRHRTARTSAIRSRHSQVVLVDLGPVECFIVATTSGMLSPWGALLISRPPERGGGGTLSESLHKLCPTIGILIESKRLRGVAETTRTIT